MRARRRSAAARRRWPTRAFSSCSRASEPALAAVAAECIARVGPAPLIVLNGGRGGEHAALALPRSRMGAQLALGGREPRGELGRAVERLADLVQVAR